MKRMILSVLNCALLAALAAGQGLFGANGQDYVNNPVSGLFSSGKISMRQSFTTSYLSSGKNGVFTNLYNNTIDCRISDKLQLQLGLGYRFTPGNANGSFPAGRFSTSSGRGMVLPSFSMRYQPTDGVMFQIQYQTIDPYQPEWWGR